MFTVLHHISHAGSSTVIILCQGKILVKLVKPNAFFIRNIALIFICWRRNAQHSSSLDTVLSLKTLGVLQTA